MPSVRELETEIKTIKERNRKVEEDKAWETSLARKSIIIVLTYISVVLFFVFAGLPNPFLNAIIPSLAFALSTLTLPIFKKIWISYRK